jgi:hypothetical protein
MRALLPDIHRAAKCHKRIEPVQVWYRFAFIKLDRMPFDLIGRKEFTKHRWMFHSRMLENQKLHFGYPIARLLEICTGIWSFGAVALADVCSLTD